MKLNNFIDTLHNTIERFKEKTMEMKDLKEADMSEGDWWEQFNSFMDLED